jgi:hypothetical protein
VILNGLRQGKIAMAKLKKYKAFSSAIAQDSELKAIRAKYARSGRKKRRQAAEWDYNECLGTEIFGVFRNECWYHFFERSMVLEHTDASNGERILTRQRYCQVLRQGSSE